MFSSSEQKAQVSFSLIACCLSVFLFVCKLFSITSRQISTKFGKKHSLVKGIQMCSKKGPHPFPRGDNNKIAKIHCQNFNLLQNQWANFNQNLHKVAMDEGDSSLYKWEPFNPLKGDNYGIIITIALPMCGYWLELCLRWAMGHMDLMFLFDRPIFSPSVVNW